MLGAAINEAVSVAFVNAALLALSAALPVLLAGYVRYLAAARRVSPDFDLRRLEANELDRAETLYRKISQRLKEIEQIECAGKGSFRERMRHRAQVREQYGAELEDLRSGAHHLRASIVRLRQRPIQRLRRWVHVISGRYALVGSLLSYVTILVPVTVFIFIAEQPAWADDVRQNLATLLMWKPIDERLLYVNGITGGLAAIALPLLYFARRVRLYSDHRTQTRALVEFAGVDFERLGGEVRPDEMPIADDAPGFELTHQDAWFTVLGLSPGATLEEVRDAYRTKIKQNHPDRVQDMAPTIRSLAEAETKRLNVAYEEALGAVRAS